MTKRRVSLFLTPFIILLLSICLLHVRPALAQSKGTKASSKETERISPSRNPDKAPPGVVAKSESFPRVQNGINAPTDTCVPGPWATSATVGPSARYRHGAVTDGTFVYVFGGGDSTGAVFSDLWRWNPATDTWTQLASMPTGKQNIQGAYWSGKIYVPGGYNGTAHLTENAIYDIASNMWTTGAPLPAAQTGTNVAFNNKIYNFGGNPGPQATVTIYDIASNTWSSGASMPVATTYGRAAASGPFAYYVGGIAAATTNAVFRYDFAANTWATMAPLQTARTSTELMVSPDGSRLFAVNGGDATFFTGVPQPQSVEIYNIGMNSWSYGNPVVTKAAASAGGLAQGKAMIQGGVDNTTYLNAVQISTVTSCVPAAQMVAAGSSIQGEGCSPSNGAIDPGETVVVSFCVQNVGQLNTASLVGTLQASGGVTNPDGPKNYGVVTAGGAAVCRTFTFTASGSCGGTITASLQLQDGATDLGTVTYTFTMGTLVPSFGENFDGVGAPALPAGWTADQGTNTAGAPLWVTSNAGTPAPPADSAPNAAFTQDPGNLCDNRLYSPVVMYGAGSILSFRQNLDLEEQSAAAAYDAGVLEININGAGYVDIVTAGGSFNAGGYNHAGINTGFSNPLLPSRPCWSGVSGGFVNVSVNLPPSGVGQPCQLRWRMGSDSSVSHTGWRVDNVAIAQRICATSCTAPATTTVVSRKAHTGVGNFDVLLPLSGTPGIECRAGGASNDYQIVATFSSAVSVSGSPQASVSSGSAAIGSGGVPNGGMVTVSGNVVTIPLTNVINAQTIIVSLNGVSDGAQSINATGNLLIPMSKLLGDTNGNGTVNASDASQTKSRIGQAVGVGNFRSDINENGAINATDASQVKSNIGTGLP